MTEQTIKAHPRGLPCVLFIADEEEFLKKTGVSFFEGFTVDEMTNLRF
jgi:hypothetical protein